MPTQRAGRNLGQVTAIASMSGFSYLFRNSFVVHTPASREKNRPGFKAGPERRSASEALAQGVRDSFVFAFAILGKTPRWA